MNRNETAQSQVNHELAALVERAQAGDQSAFTELFDRTAPDLYRCIRAMTRDEELTWDIQQDTYLRAYRSLNTLEDNNAFFPWLRRIAANVTATQMSKRLPLSFSELDDDEENAIPELPDPCIENQPELSLDRQETSRLVQEILATLPEEQHLILGMRYYDELSVKEIAELLHLAPGTVKAQLFHGRKKVETAVRTLEKQGVKLYGLSPLAFLLSLMRSLEPVTAKQARICSGVYFPSIDAAFRPSDRTSSQTISRRLNAFPLGAVPAAAPSKVSTSVAEAHVGPGSRKKSTALRIKPTAPHSRSTMIVVRSQWVFFKSFMLQPPPFPGCLHLFSCGIRRPTR